MTFDPLAPVPRLTAELPGIGGQIKSTPEDFEVEEIPAYEPSGSGDFLYLWIEKRDMGAEYFTRQLARRLDIPTGAIGSAGLKDRHAVTRQLISVPAEVEDRLEALDGDGIRVLKVSRHGNKLRAGHLHGNRFNIVVRDTHADAAERLPALVDRLKQVGMPNYYGSQRFGRDGETVKLGFALLRGEPAPGRQARDKFLRKLALSAAQSSLFNHYLGQRLADGLMSTILLGDVMSKWPFGGMFTVNDVEVEQARFNARETVHAGPMFGRKTFAAHETAAAREARILDAAGLTPASFHGFGKLLQGTRRHNLVHVDDLRATVEADGVRLCVTLPAGSYATVLLDELCKCEFGGDEREGIV